MGELAVFAAILALLISTTAGGPNTSAPAEIVRSFAEAQRAVDDAGTCLTEKDGVSAQQFDGVYQRLFELRRKVGGL